MNETTDYNIHVGLSEELQAVVEGYAAYSKKPFDLTLLEELLLTATIKLLDPWDRLPGPLTDLLPPERYTRVMTFMAELHGVSEDVIAGNILTRYLDVTEIEVALKQAAAGMTPDPSLDHARPGSKEGRA